MTAHRLPAGALVLAGEDLRLVLAVLRNAQQLRTCTGRPPLAALDALVNLAEGVPPAHTLDPEASEPMAATGQSDTRSGASRHAEHMSIHQMAAALGVSDRQARRLAPRVGGQLVAGRWLVNRQAVLEHRDGRA